MRRSPRNRLPRRGTRETKACPPGRNRAGQPVVRTTQPSRRNNRLALPGRPGEPASAQKAGAVRQRQSRILQGARTSLAALETAPPVQPPESQRFRGLLLSESRRRPATLPQPWPASGFEVSPPRSEE